MPRLCALMLACFASCKAALLGGLGDLLSPKGRVYDAPCVMGDESIMSQKKHGTSDTPVQKNLRWNCDEGTADNICNFNRHYAERGGYWERSTTFLKEESMTSGEITFYDSNTGKPLFVAPRDEERSTTFLKEESMTSGEIMDSSLRKVV